MLEFYEGSSDDNRSNASKHSRSGKKESSLIDLNRFKKSSEKELNGYESHNDSEFYSNDVRDEITMK